MVAQCENEDPAGKKGRGALVKHAGELRRWREQADLTPAELAARLGVAAATIETWERADGDGVPREMWRPLLQQLPVAVLEVQGALDMALIEARGAMIQAGTNGTPWP